MRSQSSLRRSGAASLAALCVLAGSRWLIEGAYPGLASTLWSQAAACTALAALWALLSVSSNRATPQGACLHATGVLGVLLVLCGALLGQALAGQHLGGNNATLALVLTPVVVAVTSTAFGRAVRDDLTGLLWPGLAGIAGLLLLLPEPYLQAVRPWLGLSALPLFVGVGAVLVGDRGSEQGHRSVGRAKALAAGCALAGIVFFSFAIAESVPIKKWPDTLGACALDVAMLSLTLGSLRSLGPSRWSAQFLLVPLLALGESLLVLRPTMDVRSWIGLGLLGLGAVRQLALKEEPPLGLRSIAGGEPAPFG